MCAELVHVITATQNSRCRGKYFTEWRVKQAAIPLSEVAVDFFPSPKHEDNNEDKRQQNPGRAKMYAYNMFAGMLKKKSSNRRHHCCPFNSRRG